VFDVADPGNAYAQRCRGFSSAAELLADLGELVPEPGRAASVLRPRALMFAGIAVSCPYAYSQRRRGHWSWQAEMVKRERPVEFAEHVLRNLQNGQDERPLGVRHAIPCCQSSTDSTAGCHAL
jgi:hypothetical protein